MLVKILLDETSRNQIELAEAQCGAGGGGWLEDKGVSHGARGRNVAQPEELRPGKLVNNPGTNSASHFLLPSEHL